MLIALSVRNIVLIDQLELGLGPGLTVLTGETGAGKSILLDALSLALGGRGDATLVRSGCESGQVTAIFQLARTHPARVALRANDISDDEDVILRRVQFADGRTRAFVNDQPVSAGLLHQIGSLIVEVHGQHDGRALVDPETHRDLLDAFGRHDSLVAAVRDAHRAYASARDAAEAQTAAMAEAAEREGYARHVVDELSELAPVAGEEESLAARRQALMQLEKSAEDVNEADTTINGPAAPGPVLAQLLRRLARKADAGAAHLAPVVEALDSALAGLDSASEALEALKRDMAFDPLELERIEERLFALRGAARKHQTTADGLPAVLEAYRAELDRLQSGEEVLRVLEDEAARCRAAYVEAAGKLSRARAEAAEALEHAVMAELPDLKLGLAEFAVEHSTEPGRVSAEGVDQIAFHVRTNPGTDMGPIGRIASGGELSRFLLALKVALAARGSAPVLIFDEIDTGVGGAVADAMGRRLARLADAVQVLAVTHAPQVAARAGGHLLIEKTEVGGGAFTRTEVRPLDAAARREEVARMLAGAQVTDEARAAASRLLSEVS